MIESDGQQLTIEAREQAARFYVCNQIDRLIETCQVLRLCQAEEFLLAAKNAVGGKQ
jgi:hypothetical protein